MATPVLHCFEEYQKARISFVQTIAELSTHPQNVEALYSAGVMSLLKPLLLDVVPSIQQSAALLCTATNHPDETFLATAKQNSAELAITLFKTFGFFATFPFMATHLGSIAPLWKNRRKICEKRNSAILLSKLKPEYTKEISQ